MSVIIPTTDVINWDGWAQGVSLEMTNGALKGCRTLSFECDEGISRPFLLRIQVCSMQGNAAETLADLLNQEAQVVVEEGSREFNFKGVIASAQYDGYTPQSNHLYTFEIVPPLWLLSRNRRCRVFLQQSVPDVIQTILQEFGITVSVSLDSVYPSLAYLTQYEESDLSFISRLMEQEGIYYFFAFADDGTATLSIADAASSHIDSKVTLNASAMTRGDGMVSPVFRQRMPPASATVMDYAPNQPSNPYSETASYSGTGYGALQEYRGAQPQSQSDVKRYAQIYVQEISCRQLIGYLKTNSLRIRSGYLVTIAEHDNQSYNGQYLIEEVTHRANSQQPYECTFTIIPQARLPYRPQRLTPVPRIPGFIFGTIQATAGNQNQDIDGAYAVSMLLEETQVNRVMRMAQPYAGPNQGVHFPLPPGTEVLLTHINGDPNRPIIAAALPNANNPSPVTSSNNQQGVVRSAKGAHLIFDDGDNTQQVSLTTGTGHTMVFNDLTDSPQMSLTTKGSHQLMLDDTKDTPNITLKTTGGHELKLEDVTSAPKATLLTSGGHKLVMDDTDSAPKASWTTTGGHSLTMDDTDSAPNATIKTTGGHSFTLDDTESAPKAGLLTSGGHALTLDDTEAAPAISLSSTGGHILHLDDTKAAPKASLSSTGGHSVTLDDTAAAPKVGLASKGGHQVTMDDTPEMGKIGLASTGGHKLTLDDMVATPGVTIASNGGQKIALSDLPPGVAISSGGTLSISATTSITLKVGDNSLVIDETGITLSGTMISASGQASMTLKASGEMTIKGAMVMIN